MSGDRPVAGGCEDFDVDLVELALGTLMGRHRVAVLAHVDGCPRCSADVERLSGVADELLLQAPLLEPPLGFEARVFERLNLHPQRRWGILNFVSGHLPLSTSMAAAVALAVFVVGLVVGQLGTARSPNGQLAMPQGTYLETAQLESHGHSEGEVLVYAGNPTWLFMYVDDPAWRGELRCQVTLDHGPTITLGGFWPSDGDAAWATKVSTPAGWLRQARIISPDGTVLATATLN